MMTPHAANILFKEISLIAVSHPALFQKWIGKQFGKIQKQYNRIE